METLCLIKPNLDFEQDYFEMITDWKVNEQNQIPWFINFEIKVYLIKRKFNDFGSL